MRGQKMELDKSEFTLSEAMAKTWRILNKEVLDSDLHYNKGIKLVVGGGEVERNAENDKIQPGEIEDSLPEGAKFVFDFEGL